MVWIINELIVVKFKVLIVYGYEFEEYMVEYWKGFKFYILEMFFIFEELFVFIDNLYIILRIWFRVNIILCNFWFLIY